MEITWNSILAGCDDSQRSVTNANSYAFDVIGELFYGSMFGFLKERRDVGGYMATMGGLIPFFAFVSLWPWLLDPAGAKKFVLTPNLSWE